MTRDLVIWLQHKARKTDSTVRYEEDEECDGDKIVVLGKEEKEKRREIWLSQLV